MVGLKAGFFSGVAAGITAGVTAGIKPPWRASVTRVYLKK